MRPREVEGTRYVCPKCGRELVVCVIVVAVAHVCPKAQGRERVVGMKVSASA